MEDGEGAGEIAALEVDRAKRALLDLLLDGGLRYDGDAVVDLDRALHRLDVVEFHHRLDLEAVLAEDLVDGLARRDVGVEADELLAGHLLHLDLRALRQRMLRVGDEDEVVVAEGNRVDLAVLHREGHEAEVDGVVQDVLVHEIRAAVLDADVDRGEVVQEFLDVRRQLVEADRVNGRDADRAADDLLHLLQLGEEFVISMQNLLRGIINPLTLAGQLELLLAAIDQQGLEVALHRPGLLTHRRLGDAIEFGRLGETFRFNQIGEDLEVFDLHKNRSCRRKINRPYYHANL